MGDGKPAKLDPFPGIKDGAAKDLRAVAVSRLAIGVLFAISAAGVVVYVFREAYKAISAVSEPDAKVAIAKLVAHAVVSVALVYFAYALLRAAERMFVPRSLIEGFDDATEMTRALLGIDTPVKAALRELKGFVSDIASVAKQAIGEKKSDGE